MSPQQSTALDPSTVALRLGMCAAALAGTAATVSDANATVVTFNTPISVPATTAGVYINLLTGANGTSGGAVPGYDFNPYLANGGTQLGFYWGPVATRGGGVASTTTTGPYLSLAAGTTISAASTFTAAILGTTGSAYLTSGTHTLGFKFYNETTSVFNYGYLTMTNASTNGFAATITGWSFENNGGAITIPSVVAPPVPEPSTTALLAVGALALGASNLRRLRRARQAH